MAVQTTVSNEVGESEIALARAHVHVVRTGAGRGPNALLNVTLDGVDMFSGLMQFPAIGRTTIGDDVIHLALSVSAPPGTRWCEIDLTLGDLLLYGPGAVHTSLNPEGVEYRSALIDQRILDETAESLHAPIRPPAPGSVTRLNTTAAVRALASQLFAIGSPLSPSVPTDNAGLLGAVVEMLADPTSGPGHRHIRSIESRQVVTESIRYADQIGRRPSIAELCLAAHVSERRLRSAFYDTFDTPPNTFFRTRMLSHARDRLLTGEQSVTDIALDLGFDHLGRFAGQYADVFGEHPRDTLATARSNVGQRAHRPTARPATTPALGLA